MLAIVAVTASCGLPRPGPNKKEIFAGSVLRGGDAFIVSVNSRVTRATAVMPSFGFTDAFQKAGKLGSDTIAAGDVLAVTVYENVRDDPLLGNTGQRVSQLTEVQVDGQGFIFIPYAGRIKAAGNSVEAVRASITRKLDAQTPDPQVQVARVAGDGSTVTINGSVATPGVFPIEQPTRTLAAMLARAGGVAIEPATALVRVTRGGETGKIWLKDLWANPAMDIALRPGDRIVIEEDERKFTALGATGAQTVVPFASESLSAIEALATVGGLQTMAADPTGVFVFRNEPAAIANAVLGRSDLSGDQRVVYVLDLTAPTGMFEARDFLIRDGDTVYVTEAPYVQWNKTLSVLTGSAGAAASLNSAAGN
nr:polysaccharide biosynthesis/export family protein [Pseudogemmobacter hezensis]